MKEKKEVPKRRISDAFVRELKLLVGVVTKNQELLAEISTKEAQKLDHLILVLEKVSVADVDLADADRVLAKSIDKFTDTLNQKEQREFLAP